MPVVNPEFTVEALRRRLERIGRTFPTDLGIEPLEFTDVACRGRIIVDDRHLHPGRLVHGGVWVGLGDTGRRLADVPPASPGS